ncbi:MAG TPA: matrixin family metalloprotease, partial [Bryobacteraceae bacterium]|nr:matrixin family metalloprotease [Bryobacteraceae bacterium]
GLELASGEVLGQLVSTFGEGWDGPGRNPTTLNYFFSQLTSQLPDLVTKSEITRALDEWAKVAQIIWVPDANATADHTVNILFATGDHGDGFPFDGPGGVLAHTFYPSLPTAEPLAGDMHFDDAESWHVGSNFDLFSVALHELGHALGLGSSDNPDSVMYPYYRPRTGLSAEDKTAILTLYAARSQTVPLAVTINSTPGTTTATTVSLSGTVTGGSGTPIVTWSRNGASGIASLSGTSWTAANIPLTVGLNSITVTATDTTGSASQTVSVTRVSSLNLTVNAVPASTTSATITLSGTVAADDGPPAITWSTSAGSSGLAVLNGATWLAVNIPLAVGFNTITITAVGETGSVSRSVSITRTVVPPPGETDTTGPTLTILYPSATSFATTLASLQFKGTASDRSGIASVTWSTNTGSSGTAFGTTQWSATIPLLVGFNTVIIRSTDTAGNVSSKSVVVVRR